jgi:hypothetical protein
MRLRQFFEGVLLPTSSIPPASRGKRMRAAFADIAGAFCCAHVAGAGGCRSRRGCTQARYSPHFINLPGWRWARITQLALVGSSSSLHSEVCKALRGSFGVVYSEISEPGSRIRALPNNLHHLRRRRMVACMSHILGCRRFSFLRSLHPPREPCCGMRPCGRGNSTIDDALRRCAVC